MHPEDRALTLRGMQEPEAVMSKAGTEGQKSQADGKKVHRALSSQRPHCGRQHPQGEHRLENQAHSTGRNVELEQEHSCTSLGLNTER